MQRISWEARAFRRESKTRQPSPHPAAVCAPSGVASAPPCAVLRRSYQLLPYMDSIPKIEQRVPLCAPCAVLRRTDPFVATPRSILLL